MNNLWTKIKVLFGWEEGDVIEPVWTEDHDGQVRKARLLRCKDGTILVTSINGWKVANPDGTFPPKTYMVKWWPR